MLPTGRYINLKPFWDENKVCKNPHKGWYLHYYDNGIRMYGQDLEKGDFLEDFPGLNHLYLRLAWSYLEPEEGKFNWDIIDKVIDPWTAHGYGAAFRITCKETAEDQVFATPEWVMKAGAKGNFWSNPWSKGWTNWEPDYGDPVFLEKLENFHRAFAERYDSKPWVEYIDIGSYGDWGEGHTVVSSKKDWPFEVLKEHVDIHLRHYKNSFLVINDDHIGCRYTDVDSKDRLLDYFTEKDLAFRDDSVSVLIYTDKSSYSTLRFPEMFERFWRKKPIDLELDHYRDTKKYNTWRSGFPFMAAVEEAHATFMGFHGYAREWLAENPEVAGRLANRAGYWYFAEGIEVPESIERGKKAAIKLYWRNKGVAPAYHKYSLIVKLERKDSGSECCSQVFEDSGNMRWMPGETIEEVYDLNVPQSLTPGLYKVRAALSEQKAGCKRFVELGLTDRIKASDGFYDLAEVLVK